MNAMKSRNNKITANNVFEVYEAYSAYAGIREGTTNLIDAMTSEYLGSGKGAGRDVAVQNTKHIIKQLITRAKNSGINNIHLQEAQQFVNGTSWQQGYINGTGRDKELLHVAEPIINNLIADIKATKK